MTNFLTIKNNRFDVEKLLSPVRFGSLASGSEYKFLSDVADRAREPTPTFTSVASHLVHKNTEEKLFDVRAALKLQTAQVAMHWRPDWRRKLFGQLDSLLDSENWEEDDVPPTVASYMTFLRMLFATNSERRPGLGATHDGHMVASWRAGGNRLSIECMPRDEVRWSISIKDADEPERAVGDTTIFRLMAVLAPYTPAQWFTNGNDLYPS